MSTPIRWLLMAGHVPASLTGGGIVRYTVELARGLAARDDIELFVLVQEDAADAVAQLIGNRERVIVQPAVPRALAPVFERWGLGLWLGRRFDVVHGVKHLVPWRARAHTVLTVHDMLLFDRGWDYPAPKRILLRWPYKSSLRKANTLVCVSEATRERLCAWLPSLRGQVNVVLSATGTALLEAVPVPVAAVADRTYALVVGDPSPRKNLETVVAAWAHVVETRPDALLVLVGPPAWGAASYGPHHTALIESSNLVQLVGVDDGTLRWLYQSAAVVLAPSKAEGFGLPAVEALDLGAPLVTSNDPALVEVSGPSVEHLSATDVEAWARAASTYLAGDGRRDSVPRAIRSWCEVATETVDAVLPRVISGR